METEAQVARLDTFDQDEWWDVCQKISPNISREEFNAMWKFFHEEKSEAEFMRVVQ